MAASLLASSLVAITVTLLLPVASFLLYYAILSRRPKNFPPGPSTLPLLGNLHQFPQEFSFLKFHEWGQQYGGIIGLKLGPANVVVLNDYKHVQELFDKRGALYADRPSNHIANDLIFPNETSILFLRYGEQWRLQRKAFQAMLNSKSVDDALPIQAAESTETAHQLLTNPEDWYNIMRRYPTALVLASVYGLRGATFESPRVKDVYAFGDQVTHITEIGATPPMDIFPWLRYLPNLIAPWRKQAQEIHSLGRSSWTTLYEEAREHMQQPGAPLSFLKRLLDDQVKVGLDDEHIVYVCGTTLAASSETTASSLLSFFLAMAKHPSALQKCHQEVDALCGTTRSPNAEDIRKDALPYLRAAMNETQRWRPVIPSGVPHAVTQDDHYQGYFIPAGTIVFANAWSIHRTDEFTDADEFIPERFLHDKFGTSTSAGSDTEAQRRVLYGFGAGRRVCSGQRMAEQSMLMCLAKIVWAFGLGADGHDIDDSVEGGYYPGFVIGPNKFPLKITPRSSKHAAVLESEHKEALPFLSRFKS